MQVFRPGWTLLVLVLATMSAARAAAQPQSAAAPQDAAQALRAEIDQLRKDFEARLSMLETRLSAVEGGQRPGTPSAGTPSSGPVVTAQVPSGAEGAGGPSGSLPVYGGGTASSKIFNPDIAVIGNFTGAAGRNRVRPLPAMQMPESEASFQAVVDPYARADFFLAFGETGVDLEEGFLTFPAVPGGLLVKVGKQRAAFGKVNALHTHVLPWSDRPLVTENLVNGEEGLSDAGISVARLIPNPWLFLEATGQVFRGDSGELFRSSRRSDLGYVGHLRAYRDVTESTNVDLGTSFAHGHNAAGVVDDVDLGRYTTNLFGIDATVRWRPLQRSIYHSFVGRSEIVWSRRDQPGGLQDASGFYISGDYQLGRRWFAGLRFDRSGRADEASSRDTAQSVILTYWPSEFSQIRGQFRRTNYAGNVTANELLFQFQFVIGAHGAHPF
jgi:hypothetical protein